jgi:hypothetical protein
MVRPDRYLLRMIAFLGVVGVIAAFLVPGLITAFHANPGLNSLIFIVFLTGVTLNFRQVLILKPEVGWLESWRRGQPQSSGQLILLSPMANMLGKRPDKVSLSAMALRSVLASIASRLDEQRDLARYFVGLLIFLGLLGTFWGLNHTVASIGDVIRSLGISGADAAASFEKLKSGLEGPLGGMGTAFATSLFGLAGSLVVGFLDLQAGQAQNAFYNDLEEWLAGQTRLGSGGAVMGDEQSIPSYIRALLEQTADGLGELQRAIAEQVRVQNILITKLDENQLDARVVRNIDAALNRLVDETIRSRDALVTELRSEFKLLSRTVATALEDRRTER